MWPFKKKEEAPKLIEPPPCKHKYQDFPLFVTLKYSDYERKATIDIVESYICIYCKERKDVVLERRIYPSVVSASEARNRLKLVEEELGDKCKPIYEIEDMIQDFRLVDREWLELAKFVRSGRIAKKEGI